LVAPRGTAHATNRSCRPPVQSRVAYQPHLTRFGPWCRCELANQRMFRPPVQSAGVPELGSRVAYFSASLLATLPSAPHSPLNRDRPYLPHPAGENRAPAPGQPSEGTFRERRPAPPKFGKTRAWSGPPTAGALYGVRLVCRPPNCI